MPVDYTQAFAEFLATPPQTGRMVQGVNIYGNPYLPNYHLANNIYEPVVLPDENGDQRTWAPTNFELKPPDVKGSLERALVITISGLRPDVVAGFDRLPPEAGAVMTLIRLYVWIVPTAMAAPQILPPPRFVLERFLLSANGLKLDCSGPLLPNWRAGAVFSVEKFPGLTTE